jgi:phosphoribosyl-ATP pyrophosphohydrolase
MIIPSIDIRAGRAVQLRGGKPEGGKYPILDVGDPEELAGRLSLAGEIAIVDLDAALGLGDNSGLIKKLIRKYPARVGGGIRSVAKALEYLDAGARSVVIGTKADPEFLSALPSSRVIAALDIKDGVVMVEGWTKATDGAVTARMQELAPFVAGFLVTFIEREGSMEGLDMERSKALLEAAKGRKVTFAGGAQAPREIAALDALGADVQSGTALALGRMSLAQAFSAPLVSDRPDGLWPTTVCDEGGRLLGLTWSSLESLERAFELGAGVYHSRKRGIWVKGESSGDRQVLIRVETDCDRDTLRFTVRQEGRGFCHTGSWTCFDDGCGLEKLSRTIIERRRESPPGSYTHRLFEDASLLASKLREEADELARAQGPLEAAAEAADLIYFALVKAETEGARLADIEAELDRRSLKVRRRGGDAKAAYKASGEDLSWTGIH